MFFTQICLADDGRSAVLTAEGHTVAHIVFDRCRDFIFTYVGQCFGFLGCIALIAALSFICLKIVVDSRIAKDDLGKFMCIGVFSMVFIHCILNLGMVLGVMPVIGVPLPFVSQGGTSMASMFVCIGLVMSVYSHSEKNYRLFYDAN